MRSHLRRRVRGFLVESKLYKSRRQATMAHLRMGFGG